MDQFEQRIRNVVEPLLEDNISTVRYETELRINGLESKLSNYNKAEQNDSVKNNIYIPVTFNLSGTSAATAGNYGYVFSANRSCEIVYVAYIYKTAGTDGGTVEIQLEKLPSGVALGSGDSILTYAGSLKQTAGILYKQELASSQARFVREGESVAIKLTGTPTSVNDLCVTIGIRYE